MIYTLQNDLCGKYGVWIFFDFVYRAFCHIAWHKLWMISEEGYVCYLTGK